MLHGLCNVRSSAWCEVKPCTLDGMLKLMESTLPSAPQHTAMPERVHDILTLPPTPQLDFVVTLIL